ncbi:MAG: isoprenylcysteine carboxylmethyltransferase family protein [Anaerolineaceae bacterium]|nr:isoprenylcysteine carboxylmethyltransferase family protein [Anaerolineaceae bacterium]
MNIKGLDQLRKHVPDFNSPFGVLRILFLPILLIFLVTALLSSAHFASAVWMLVAENTIGCLGFLLLYAFVRCKDNFKAHFGALAYGKAASLLGYPGVAIISAVVARIRSIPGPEIPSFGWHIVLPILGWALIAVGLLLSLRAVLTFGLDYLVMLYVYFPEESHIVDHKIYKVLRHPAYSGAQFIAFGLALLNGNWFALACAVFFALGLWAWVHLVEEKELIERFGSSYLDYRRRVPAFWPRLHDLKEFFEFLIFGR